MRQFDISTNSSLACVVAHAGPVASGVVPTLEETRGARVGEELGTEGCTLEIAKKSARGSSPGTNIVGLRVT